MDYAHLKWFCDIVNDYSARLWYLTRTRARRLTGGVVLKLLKSKSKTYKTITINVKSR